MTSGCSTLTRRNSSARDEFAARRRSCRRRWPFPPHRHRAGARAARRRSRWRSRTPIGAWSSPTAASCTPTATGCSARSTTPRTPFRTRCCGHGAGCRASRGEARCAPWLYRIATNACLTAIERRPKRLLPIDHGPPVGSPRPLRQPAGRFGRGWSPTPTSRSGSRTAALPPRPATSGARAWSWRSSRRSSTCRPTSARCSSCARCSASRRQEVAEALETTAAAVNSALQRARKTVDERLPERSQQATLRALGDQRLAEVVAGYMDAMGRGDVDAVVAMLAQDAVWSMPPLAAWYRGRERDRRLPGHRAAERRVALAPRAGACQRAGRGRLLRVGRGRAGPICRSRSTC